MFLKPIRTLVLAVVVALGGIAINTSTSNAASGYVEFGTGNSGIHFSSGRGYRSHHRKYDRYDRRHRNYKSRRYDRHNRRSRHYSEYNYRRGVCAPRKALRKARRMGVRHAHIARVNQRVIVIKGRRYGDRAKVKFGRSRHCPVIAFRNISY